MIRICKSSHVLHKYSYLHDSFPMSICFVQILVRVIHESPGPFLFTIRHSGYFNYRVTSSETYTYVPLSSLAVPSFPAPESAQILASQSLGYLDSWETNHANFKGSQILELADHLTNTSGRYLPMTPTRGQP